MALTKAPKYLPVGDKDGPVNLGKEAKSKMPGFCFTWADVEKGKTKHRSREKKLTIDICGITDLENNRLTA